MFSESSDREAVKFPEDIIALSPQNKDKLSSVISDHHEPVSKEIAQKSWIKQTILSTIYFI